MRVSSFKQAIDTYCEELNLIPNNTTIILGLSGGPDSMALLHYLADLRSSKNITIIAAHLDHEWRTNSQNDEQFCHIQAEKLGIKFVSARASELSFKPKFSGSKEDLGRLMRRHFFETIKQDYHADFIALAHHRQDQQETFFIRLIRGTSLTGLTAIKPRQGSYIRPLLNSNRTDIIAYLDANQIPYLKDPSNESTLYLRNRIRHQLLPSIRAIDNRFDQNFNRTLVQLKETDELLHEITIETMASISSIQDDTLFIHTKKFNVLHKALKKRIIIAWLIHEQVAFIPSEKFLNEVIKFMAISAGKTHRLQQTWSINKKRSLASIIKHQHPTSDS